MNREIKFNAFDKKYEIMLHNVWFDKISISSYVYNKEIDSRKLIKTPREDCILLQFTGLKDKNGKDIYEGDITKQTPYNSFGIVKFYQKCASFEIKGKTDWDWSFPLSQYSGEFEIVGNIHTATKEQLKEWGIEK